MKTRLRTTHKSWQPPKLALLAARCYAMKHIKMLPKDGKENAPRRINYVEQYNRAWDSHGHGSHIIPARDPKQCGGQESNEVQATIATEQKQIRLIIGSFVTAAAGTCLCTRSNSMCRTVYSNLIPRHGRDGHKMVKEWPSIYSRWFYKTFRQELPWTSQKNLHTSTSIPEHFQDLNARTS